MAKITQDPLREIYKYIEALIEKNASPLLQGSPKRKPFEKDGSRALDVYRPALNPSTQCKLDYQKQRLSILGTWFHRSLQCQKIDHPAKKLCFEANNENARKASRSNSWDYLICLAKPKS